MTPRRQRRGVLLFVCAILAADALLPDKARAATASTLTSHIWSGYLAHGGTDFTGYLAVRGEFLQPAITNSCQPYSDLMTWVGLGGWNPDHSGRRRLLQVGTVADYDIASGVTYSAFYQFIRARGRIQDAGIERTAIPLSVRPGDRILAYVSMDLAMGKATFRLGNTTTGRIWVGDVTLSPAAFYDATTAEFVSERTAGISLARFGVAHWTDARVRRTEGRWHGVAEEHRLSEIRMKWGSKILAAPGRMSSTGGFAISWGACR